jgi:hypothetical protein
MQSQILAVIGRFLDGPVELHQTLSDVDDFSSFDRGTAESADPITMKKNKASSEAQTMQKASSRPVSRSQGRPRRATKASTTATGPSLTPPAHLTSSYEKLVAQMSRWITESVWSDDQLGRYFSIKKRLIADLRHGRLREGVNVSTLHNMAGFLGHSADVSA